MLRSTTRIHRPTAAFGFHLFTVPGWVPNLPTVVTFPGFSYYRRWSVNISQRLSGRNSSTWLPTGTNSGRRGNYGQFNLRFLMAATQCSSLMAAVYSSLYVCVPDTGPLTSSYINCSINCPYKRGVSCQLVPAISYIEHLFQPSDEVSHTLILQLC